MGRCIETLSSPNKFLEEVTNITDYGAFVEIESGIEGLACFRNGLDQ